MDTADDGSCHRRVSTAGRLGDIIRRVECGFLLAGVAMCGGCASGANIRPAFAATGQGDAVFRRSTRGCETRDSAPLTVLDGTRIDAAMPCLLHSAIVDALETAVSTLRRENDCREMFFELGADGIEILGNTTFYVADTWSEVNICDRAVAFTSVGGRRTWLCRHFAYLSDLDAAAVILHEALHQAGLGEWPLDRRGRKSRDITTDIRRRCGFDSGQ